MGFHPTCYIYIFPIFSSVLFIYVLVVFTTFHGKLISVLQLWCNSSKYFQKNSIFL
jgi:hypothetical protein